MNSLVFITTISCSVLILPSACAKRYTPDWESLDSRPLPPWFDEAKLGIFLHWGVFSVPAIEGAWFWNLWKSGKNPELMKYMKDNYKPDFTYAEFAKDFTAKFYDPNKWAEVFEASGARYVVLVTKHHEGFCNWPSNYSWNWNAKDVGPNRDLVGELATAIRSKTNMHFGVYHSLFEWYNPLFMQDAENHYKTQEFVKRKTLPELYELVNNYLPEVIWSDGDWMTDSTYWNATEFLTWLFNDSPVKDTVVVNDRWGKNVNCKHGSFWNCHDKYDPGVVLKHKWENAMTLDKKAWSYRRQANIEDFLTMEELLQVIAETVSCGGNVLLNVGPTADGTLIPMYQERLRQLGAWLKVNGDAIYSTVPWKHQRDSVEMTTWYTSKKTANGVVVYAIMPALLTGESLVFGSAVPTDSTTVSLVGYDGYFDWRPFVGGMEVNIPLIPLQHLPCQWAWVLKFENLKD